MMMTMVSSPPKRSLLRGCLGHKGYDELKNPGGLVGFMCEIAMVSARYPKHPEDVQKYTDRPIK